MFLVIPGRVLRSSHISHTAVCSSKIQNVCSRPTVCQTQNPKGRGEDRKGTDPVAPVVLVLWVEWARREGRGARVSEVRNATSWERCSHGTLGSLFFFLLSDGVENLESLTMNTAVSM